MKILVVDDSKTMRMIVRKTLKDAGFGGHDVDEASNGDEALDKIRADLPDLVLSDWNMPKMTGIELLEALNSKDIKVPFGFVTSEGTEEMVTRAQNAGSRFHITKPFTKEKFVEALSPIINN